MKIAFLHQYEDYENSLPILITRKLLGAGFEVTTPSRADIVFIGQFSGRRNRGLRKYWNAVRHRSDIPNPSALRIFQNYENTRPDGIDANYRITSDLGVASERHYRLPIWMESIDWSHEGIANKPNPRVSRLLTIKQLSQPLGSALLNRPRQAALFTSHMREPRKVLFEAMAEVMPTQGFGRPFDATIRSHNESGIAKDEVLRNFAVNLCPENSLYPGYYTEKVVEAFGAGCLPVTWAEPSIRADFNPLAFVNALDHAATGYIPGLREALAPEKFSEYADQPLLLDAPSIEPLIEFLKKALADAR
jgi:hypothetical protein